jgi:hypothetical protein
MTTMEFLQQEWINNRNFIASATRWVPTSDCRGRCDLHDPQAPVRRRIHRIETFNVVRVASTSSCRRSRR